MTVPPVMIRRRDVIARDQASATHLHDAVRGAEGATRTARGTTGSARDRRRAAPRTGSRSRGSGTQAWCARQDQIRRDPATSCVGQRLQIPHDTLELAATLVFGPLLECVAYIG
ncbi:hypothetical protein [Burkholderia territorii]|uniref:hypothetical protein n=1 Tax=Burkholderia territorii TaxID=1503055 RepID=UPI0012D9B5B5|nr:hypothetical protein [Burkholderia territorii]